MVFVRFDTILHIDYRCSLSGNIRGNDINVIFIKIFLIEMDFYW